MCPRGLAPKPAHLQQLLSVLHPHRQLLLPPSCQQLQGRPCDKQFFLLGVALHDALRQGCSRQGGNSLSGQAGCAGMLGTAAHAAVGQALRQVSSTEGCSGWGTQAACVPAGASHYALLHQEAQCSSGAMHDCSGPPLLSRGATPEW